MPHDLVRFRELVSLFRERRVLVVSVVNSLAVLVMACVLGIFLEVTEKRRAYAERIEQRGALVELSAQRSPRIEGNEATQAPPTGPPTRVLRTRAPARPRSRPAPPPSSGSREYPVEVRRAVPPLGYSDPEGGPAYEDPLPRVEDPSSFDLERPPIEE